VDERLAGLRDGRSHEDDERRLVELQVAGIRWRVEHDQAQAGERLRLARLLCGMTLSPASDVTREDVLVAARAAHAEAPSDPATLELFAAALLDCGRLVELGEVLRTLEQLAPHSEVLEMMRRQSRDEPELAARAAALPRRHEDLTIRAMQGAAENPRNG
jgi:hypothetical protein